MVCRGHGYLADLREGLEKLPSDIYVVCSCDVPFITGRNIEEALRAQRLSGSPYVYVVVPAEVPLRVGIKPTTLMKIGDSEVCPAGIRVVVSDFILRNGWVEPLYLRILDEGLAVNINTHDDLAVAERIASGPLSHKLGDQQRL